MKSCGCLLQVDQMWPFNSITVISVAKDSVAEWLACLTAVWEDPGSNHTADSCVYRDSCCNIQSWARAVQIYCSA